MRKQKNRKYTVLKSSKILSYAGWLLAEEGISLTTVQCGRYRGNTIHHFIIFFGKKLRTPNEYLQENYVLIFFFRNNFIREYSPILFNKVKLIFNKNINARSQTNYYCFSFSVLGMCYWSHILILVIMSLLCSKFIVKVCNFDSSKRILLIGWNSNNLNLQCNHSSV